MFYTLDSKSWFFTSSQNFYFLCSRHSDKLTTVTTWTTMVSNGQENRQYQGVLQYTVHRTTPPFYFVTHRSPSTNFIPWKNQSDNITHLYNAHQHVESKNYRLSITKCMAHTENKQPNRGVEKSLTVIVLLDTSPPPISSWIWSNCPLLKA